MYKASTKPPQSVHKAPTKLPQSSLHAIYKRLGIGFRYRWRPGSSAVWRGGSGSIAGPSLPGTIARMRTAARWSQAGLWATTPPR